MSKSHSIIGAGDFLLIAGPCAVESRASLFSVAQAVAHSGAHALRGGAFKPRTSPDSFQGLGIEALALLAEAAQATSLPIVTEVMDVRHVADVAEVASVLQIGARSMQNIALLREAAATGLPILLKRHFGATLEEFIGASQYIRSAGNDNVILCERGIRSFETATRFTLDVAAIPILQSQTGLPVLVDPSHAAGTAGLVRPLALAAVAAGADGLMVEVHQQPSQALSDGAQSLTVESFSSLAHDVLELAAQPLVAATRKSSTTRGIAIPGPRLQPTLQVAGDAR